VALISNNEIHLKETLMRLLFTFYKGIV